MNTHEKFLALKDAGVVVEGLQCIINTGKSGGVVWLRDGFIRDDHEALEAMDAAAFKAMPEKLPGLDLVLTNVRGTPVWYVADIGRDDWLTNGPTATDAFLAAWAARKEG